MSARTATRAGRNRSLAIGLAVLATIAGTTWMTVLNGGTAEGLGETFALALAFYAYLVVGLVMLARLPGHRLGWVMTAIGVITSVGVLAQEYARFGLVTRAEPVIGSVFAAWVAQWWWFPAISLVLVIVPLLFPTGRVPGPRWRWLLRAAVTIITITTFGAALAPELVGDDYRVPNPIGVGGVGDIEGGLVGNVLFLGLAFCMALTLVSLIFRFRRSKGVERQQMKWFVFAGALTIAVPTLEEFGGDVVINSNVLFAMVVMLQPLAIGIAVLRYRLYEIDRLISRTLTYGLLTALLLGVYFGGVTILSSVTALFAGSSPIAVAAATLLTAAFFGPARRRIQSVVDRRFNRARYDAVLTVDAYRAGLRDELELGTITEQLQGVVQRTIQPSATSVWLRGVARES